MMIYNTHFVVLS